MDETMSYPGIKESLDKISNCGLSEEYNHQIKPFLNLMQELDPDPKHALQVAYLTTRLFDELQPVHNLEPRHRFLLSAAALCHDIGWSKSGKKHNKASRDIIIAYQFDDLSSLEQTMIALVARYHKGKRPKSKHKYFGDLGKKNRLIVKKMAALLRIADGLDHTHTSRVKDIHARDDGETVVLCIISPEEVLEERYVLKTKKQSLFEKVMSRKMTVTVNDCFTRKK